MWKLAIRSGAAVAMIAAVVGCGGGAKLAPVSGTVMLDGKPYPNAVVSFQPIATKENPTPGRGSSAFTDEQGKFVLLYDDGSKGAVVGKHLVRIMTKGNNVVGQDKEGGSDDGAAPRKDVDPIPPEWNAASKVEFDVPAAGTDKADFDIKTRKGGAKK